MDKVDWRTLYAVRDLSTEQRVVLELAEALQREENPDYLVVSCQKQKEAADYFNEHGLEKTLELLCSKEG